MTGNVPIYVVGWLADYPDPHNFVHPYMHSKGLFSGWQGYNNPTADFLVNLGIETADGPAREAIYFDLQALYHEDAPSVPLVTALGRGWQPHWFRGWYSNPIIPSPGMVYHRWKAVTHYGDANEDGAVNVLDNAVLSTHWQTPITNPYNPRADLTGGRGGTTDPITGDFTDMGPVPGIADGAVDIFDSAFVSAYWD